MYPSDNYYTYVLGVDNLCCTSEFWNDCAGSSGRTNDWIYNTNSNSQ